MPEFEKSKGFKMKGWSGFVNSPMKQTTDPKKKKEKTYPPSYTEEDKKFLKEQNEDIVRRSDFDEGSIQQKMFDCNQNPKTRWDNKLKKCVAKNK